MPNFYALFIVIAVAAAILWASRQGKPSSPSVQARPSRPTDTRQTHPMAWIALSLLGAVLLAAGVVLCFRPGEPDVSGGGKGGAVLIYLAYWLLGDYGPAITSLALGATCLYKAYTLVRDD